MKVLYIHMIGAFGGASRSLTEAIAALPEGAVQPHFVTAAGTVEQAFGRLGPVIAAKGMTQFDNTRYSHYRGLRWLVLLRELAYLPATIGALRRAKARWGDFDLIHVNEMTGLLPWWLASRWFKAPVVVHVRSVARVDGGSLRTRLVNWMFRRKAAAVIAIDETVRASLPAELPVTVIHNAFTPGRVPADAPVLVMPDSLRPTSFKVGFVGNLLRVKGINELVAAAAIVRDRGLDVEYLIVGGDAAPSRGIKAGLLRLLGLGQNAGAEVLAEIDRLGVRDCFHMLGFTQRIAQAYDYMDVLCFPSHYDAPGRPVFEAAMAGKPSIVSLSRPRSDTLIDGVTGLAIRAHDPEAIADAIEELDRDRIRGASMGKSAQAMALDTFDAKTNSEKLFRLYAEVALSHVLSNEIKVSASS